MTNTCAHPLCDSTDIKRLHQWWKGDIWYCNFCCHQWLAAAPVTEHQAAWLAIRGLTCDGTKEHAADLIGDRIPWRKEPPTEVQAAWFAARGLALPKTGGEAAKTMYYAHWGVEEKGI